MMEDVDRHRQVSIKSSVEKKVVNFRDKKKEFLKVNNKLGRDTKKNSSNGKGLKEQI